MAKPISDQNVAVYMRVSQMDLHLENQKPCLDDRIAKEGFNPARITFFTEEMSSGKERPVKNSILQDCKEGKYDVVMFARLDRWGRSMMELVGDVEQLVKLDVRVIIPKTGMDISKDDGAFNSTNRLVLQIFAAFAEYKRSLLQERTKDGVARARAWGKIVGRHPVGCGCGLKSEDGKRRHNGSIKPIRDDKNRIIGWKPPEAQDQAQEPAKVPSVPDQEEKKEEKPDCGDIDG
jgi:DNA invertase Pin-like site-specific DNA recombinase